MPSQPRPLVVIEGPPGCAEPEIGRLQASGVAVLRALRAPIGPEPTVCVGVVDDASSATAALLAAIAGAGLVVEARADRAVIDRLVDDLRRLGRVDHRIGRPEAAPVLDPEARAILGLLAEGHSLGEAAEILGLARRTADRRLADARRALGVDRTTEAIARARRQGWLGPRSIGGAGGG